jgi:hypothetical protein
MGSSRKMDFGRTSEVKEQVNKHDFVKARRLMERTQLDAKKAFSTCIELKDSSTDLCDDTTLSRCDTSSILQ